MQQVSSQREFEAAFAQGSGEIVLAPGNYDIPTPADPTKAYVFHGAIIGAGKKNVDVKLNGIFIVDQNQNMTIENLVMQNNGYENGLVVLSGAQVNLKEVAFWSDSTDSKNAVDVNEDASLIMDNVLVDYENYGLIHGTENSKLIVQNSSLQGLDVRGKGASILISESEIGEILVEGALINAQNLELVTHNNYPTKYVHFNQKSDNYAQFKGKYWICHLSNVTMVARNLKFPAELPDNLAPLWIDNSVVSANISNRDQLTYTPWVEVENSKVDIKDVISEPPSNRDVNTSEMPKNHDAVKELQQLIGLGTVKQQVVKFINMASYKQKRKAEGIKISNSLHSLFEGNPGTGKTTVARLVGKIMYQEGILPTSNYVEVDRGDLVAGYVGQTAKKTTKVLKKATGGVLFIDEAYSLVNGNQDSFGQEALDTLMKYMEDHRDELMIIFAGYTSDMEKLLAYNQGMKSRVPNVFTFDDYSPDEIAQIGRLQLKKLKLKFDQPSTADIYDQLVKELYINSDDHSNGRWIRNKNDALLNQIATATVENKNHPLNEIWADDIQQAFGGTPNLTASNNPNNESKNKEARSSVDENHYFNRKKPLPFINGDELK